MCFFVPYISRSQKSDLLRFILGVFRSQNLKQRAVFAGIHSERERETDTFQSREAGVHWRQTRM